MRLAIFGGTFDPIHSAHLTVAQEAARQFGLARVLFVPASRPPHKGGFTCAPYEDRFRMVQLACADEPLFEASRLEAGRRKSYSIFTIRKVKASLGPSDQLFFLIGADAFAEIETWYCWPEVIHEIVFIVVTRPGHHYATPPGARVHTLETVALPISSSHMRARLAAGQDPPEIPSPVLSYIRQHGLYR